MSWDWKEITFLPSAQRMASINSEDFDLSKYSEMLIFLEITGQGVFTDESLTATFKTKSPNDKYHGKGSFTQVGNVTGSLPHYDHLEVANLGIKGRIEVVLAGTAKDYTFSVTAYAKRIF